MIIRRVRRKKPGPPMPASLAAHFAKHQHTIIDVKEAGPGFLTYRCLCGKRGKFPGDAICGHRVVCDGQQVKMEPWI